MNPVAYATLYPVACPACRTITSRRAAEILRDTSVNCRQCDTTIRLSESQLNKLRRTVADLSECHQRSNDSIRQACAVTDQNPPQK